MVEVVFEEVSKFDYVKYKKCERFVVKKFLLVGYEESCLRKYYNFKFKISLLKFYYI